MLRTRAPADQARLERLVADALPAQAGAISGSMLLRRTSVLPQFVVHVKHGRHIGASGRQPDFGEYPNALP